MANVDIKLGYKDSAWFTANPTLILKQGQIVALEQTGTYKLGDGVTQLSALTFLGSSGGGSWGSITGTLSNQTDLQNALNTKEDTSNKSIDIDTDQASNTKYPSVKAIYDWVVGLFVKKGTLTTNYIPKATASDTIGDSQIFDNGTNVGIGTTSPTGKLHVYNSGSLVGEIESTGNAPCLLDFKNDGADYNLRLGSLNASSAILDAASRSLDIKSTNEINLGIGSSVSLNVNNNQNVGIGTGSPSEKLHVNGNIRCDNLTPSQSVETDANKNLVSVTHYTESFAYTGSPFTLTVAPNYIFSIRTTSMVLDESDINDVTIVGTTLTVINPAFQSGETLYIKYKG